MQWADRSFFICKKNGVTFPAPLLITELIGRNSKSCDHAVKPSNGLGAAAAIEVEIIVYDALIQWWGMSHGCNELKYAHHIAVAYPADGLKGILNKSLETQYKFTLCIKVYMNFHLYQTL